MSLKLNTSREPFKEFYGQNVKQMPKLIAEGRVPMNTAQLMQKRLDVRNSDPKVKDPWMNNYFDTGDGIVYHPDGRVKVVLDSQHLRDMTPESPRNGGALIIGEDVYNTLEGEEFKKGKLGKVNERMSKADIKADPKWKVLAREQALLDDYADYIFAEGNYDTAMGVYTGSANGDTPEMRAWYVNRLGSRSTAYGRYDLDLDYGRFVGIAPEALGASNKGASNVKTYTMADLQAANKAVQGLEGTLHPDVLKPFADLIKKL